jgi:S-adenosyl methyltransferase
VSDDAAAARPALKLDTTVSHSARIWNYWLGGKGNFLLGIFVTRQNSF